MKLIKSICIIFVLVLLLFSFSIKENISDSKNLKPNIIYIMADDLGYGDLSCFGQQKFSTPNIDKLAENGILFTQHYSGSTVCAPSRSSLLTGLHTGHTPIRGNKELEGEGQFPLPNKSFTIAELMKKAGYKTGAFGKWGLGFIGSEGDPNKQGFDDFYGYNCQRMAHRYYPTHLWHNEQKVMLEGNDWAKTTTYAPDEIQKRTLAFIEQNKETPFFAYVPLVQPHAELMVPDDEILESFIGQFEEVPYKTSNSSTSDYGKDLEISQYSSQKTPFAVHAAMISRIDKYIGEIVEKLEDFGLSDNTIIMFTSDNGPHAEGGANPKFFNSSGGLKGIKRDLYEGGIRVPFIVSWPGTIKSGSRSDHISAFWDVLPTFADLTKQELPRKLDGTSFLPTLLGQNNQEEHAYLYWEFSAIGGRQAVRMGNWKGIIYNINEGEERVFELYDLLKDVGETTNVAKDHPDIVNRIKLIMDEAHEKSELFPLLKDEF